MSSHNTCSFLARAIPLPLVTPLPPLMEKWMVILPEGPISMLLHCVGQEYHHSYVARHQRLQAPPLSISGLPSC
eukprot:7727699-Heterocapsa_arctica.AAC.1